MISLISWGGGKRIAILSVIKHEKKMMAFQWFTKFVVDHDPGHYSLEVEGLLAI